MERHTCGGECFADLNEKAPDFAEKIRKVLDCLVYQGVLAKLPDGAYIAVGEVN